MRRVALLTAVLAGCYLSHELGGDAPTRRDAAVPRDDAGHGGHDGGPPVDFGTPPVDLGTDACTPPTVDPGVIGMDCEPSLACPPGYACSNISGAVLQHRCEIPCRTDCDCPASTTCEPFSDKSGTRLFCAAPVILI